MIYKLALAGARRNKPLRQTKGTTLLEVVATLAIAAILSSLAVTNFTEQIPHQQLRQSGQDLMGQLRLTRQKAIADGITIHFPFAPQFKQYGNPLLGQQTLPNNVRFGIPRGVTNAPNKESTLPPDGVDFQGKDVAFQPDGTGEIGTIYLVNSKEETIAISVNMTGRVKQWIWDGNVWK